MALKDVAGMSLASAQAGPSLGVEHEGQLVRLTIDVLGMITLGQQLELLNRISRHRYFLIELGDQLRISQAGGISQEGQVLPHGSLGFLGLVERRHRQLHLTGEL